MLDKSLLIERYLKLLGRDISIVTQDGKELTVFAILQQSWRRNQSRFDSQQFEIGSVNNEYCSYIGPAYFDITKLSKKDVVICDDKKYRFIKTEPVRIGGKTQFYCGVLKRLWDGDYNAYS